MYLFLERLTSDKNTPRELLIHHDKVQYCPPFLAEKNLVIVYQTAGIKATDIELYNEWRTS